MDENGTTSDGDGSNSNNSNNNNNNKDRSNHVAAMSAGRAAVRVPGQPTKYRDGFDLISRQPLHFVPYDHHNLDNNSRSSSRSTTMTAFVDITYDVCYPDRCCRIAFNRPDVLHAFRPQTIREIQRALHYAVDDLRVGVIVFTSNNNPYNNNHSPAFCAGGDQTVRSNQGGYQDGTESFPKLRVLELQREMRCCPKPILCVVDGYAIGGGHILQMVSDLTIASDRSVFGQTGPRMGSFDAGYGSTRMARLIGQKRARELWFLCRYVDADEAYRIGLINATYPVAELDGRVAQWVRRMTTTSPTALAAIKAALNADEDGDLQQLGGMLTELFYKTKESQEGRDAFLQHRPPDFNTMRSKL